MTDYTDISRSMLADAMLESINEGIAAGFSKSKKINGVTPEEWVDKYIIDLIGEDEEEEDES